MFGVNTVLAACLVLLTSLKCTLALYCLKCDSVASAVQCKDVMECATGEVCFQDMFVEQTGRISRKFGCRNKAQCSAGIVGKRSGELTVCSRCCDGNLCHTNLCNDNSVYSPRGPYCFKCDRSTLNFCRTAVTICGRDEECFETMDHSVVDSNQISAGCYGKTLCDRLQQNGGGKYLSCCSSDLCHSKPPNVTHTVTTTAAPTTRHTAPCVDSTSAATCQIASTIVCKDRDMAANAGCLHTCKFC